MDAWEVAARVEIDDLMARYSRAADRGQSTELARLFTDGGVLVAGDDHVQGPAAITAYLEATKASLAGRDPAGRIRHHVSSRRVEFTDPTSARATSYFLAITGTGPDHWGIYRDELVHDGTGWRFERRTAVVEGHAPGSWAADRGAHAR